MIDDRGISRVFDREQNRTSCPVDRSANHAKEVDLGIVFPDSRLRQRVEQSLLKVIDISPASIRRTQDQDDRESPLTRGHRSQDLDD